MPKKLVALVVLFVFSLGISLSGCFCGEKEIEEIPPASKYLEDPEKNQTNRLADPSEEPDAPQGYGGDEVEVDEQARDFIYSLYGDMEQAREMVEDQEVIDKLPEKDLEIKDLLIENVRLLEEEAVVTVIIEYQDTEETSVYELDFTREDELTLLDLEKE